MGERIDAFNQFRSEMNESILSKETLQTKRFFNLDGAVDEDGALSARCWCKKGDKGMVEIRG